MTDNHKKMSDHPLIQDGWVPKVGDWTDKGLIYDIIMGGTSLPLYRVAFDTNAVISYYKSDLTRLPSQRDLQGMVISKTSDQPVFDLIVDFDEWFFYVDRASTSGRTMQELWLAFVMHKKHSLRWTGERWE